MRKTFSKKILLWLVVLTVVIGYSLPFTVLALDYVPLVTLPGASEAGKPLTNAGEYIKGAFNLAIGIAAVLAIIMIVFGGIQYMGTESIGGKGAGLKKIKDAVLGLLLALGSYVLLFTINPSLVNFNLTIAEITLPATGQPTVNPDDTATTKIQNFTTSSNATLFELNTNIQYLSDQFDKTTLNENDDVYTQLSSLLTNLRAEATKLDNLIKNTAQQAAANLNNVDSILTAAELSKATILKNANDYTSYINDLLGASTGASLPDPTKLPGYTPASSTKYWYYILKKTGSLSVLYSFGAKIDCDNAYGNLSAELKNYLIGLSKNGCVLIEN